MDGVNRFVVDLRKDIPDVVRDHGGCFFHDGPGRFTDAPAQFPGQSGDSLLSFSGVAEGDDALHDHGVRRRGKRPAQGNGRSLSLRADHDFAFFDFNDAVAAHADGFGVKTANQRFTAVDGDAGRFQKRNAVGENGDVRGGAADVQRDGIFLDAGRRQHAHDSRRRTRMDGLHGAFQRFVDEDRSAVRLQNIDGNVRSDSGDELEDIVHKGIVDVMDGRVEVGGGDPAREIQLPRKGVPQGNDARLFREQFGGVELLLRIAAGKFANNADMPDGLFGNVIADFFHFPAADVLHGNAAVVDVTLGEIRVLSQVQRGGRKPRTAEQHHGNAVGFVLHNRVGGNGRAQNDALDIIDIVAGNQLLGRLQKRGHDICLIREHLGFFYQLKILNQNSIRMGSADVNTKYHYSVL